MRKIKRRKEKNKKRIIVISLFLFLIIMTSGYAAFNTNISLHAKGNIKCNPQNIEEKIKKDITTEGDGLYKDEYTEGRFVYRGTNPNNYIEFNNELWRIIAKEQDGTLKIVRNDFLDQKMSFDTAGNRTTGYCSQGDAPTNGCNAWSSTASMLGSPAEFINGSFRGIVDKDSEINTYLNGEYYNSLSPEAQNLIINYDYNIGGVTYNTSLTMQEQLENESTYKWNGKVALINLSDYMLANSNQEQCGTSGDNYSSGNFGTCRNTTWMYYNNRIWWTLTPYALSDTVWDINGSGHLGNGYKTGINVEYVRPVVHIKSSLTVCGEGTQNNPYQIQDNTN